MFYLLLIKPLLEVVITYAVLNANVADTCPSECCKVSTTIQGTSYITGQGPDIGTLAANNTYGGLHLFHVKACQLYLVYVYMLRFQLYVLTVSAIVERALTVHLHGTVCRRYLVDVANKLRQCLLSRSSVICFVG